MLDRVEREVELGNHPAGLERGQHLAQPGLRPVVEGQDHRPPRQAGAVVPVRGEVAWQDRRVAMRLEPVELGLERRRQRVIGEERALPLRAPRAEAGRDGLHAVVVDDRNAAARDVQRRGGRRRQGRVWRRVEGGERGRRRRRGRRARTRAWLRRRCRRRGNDGDRAGIRSRRRGRRRGTCGLATDEGDRDDGQHERHETARAAIVGHGIPHGCVGRSGSRDGDGSARRASGTAYPASSNGTTMTKVRPCGPGSPSASGRTSARRRPSRTTRWPAFRCGTGSRTPSGRPTARRPSRRRPG